MAVSAAPDRDSTEDWLLPDAARPRSFAELEAKIDYAVAVARSAEEAALAFGDVAIEGAAQARLAAEMAEAAAHSAAQMEERQRPGVSSTGRQGPVPADPFERRLEAFRERASRVSTRLISLSAS